MLNVCQIVQLHGISLFTYMYLSSRTSIFNVVCGERNLPIRMTGGFPFAGKSRLPGHCQLGRTESSMGGRVRGKCTELSWRLVVLDVL